MNTPEISVVMPVFNAERYIREAVESVLAQTFRDFELIIVDDASTDESMQIVRGIDDARIRILVNARNMGAAESKNRAIGNAYGEWIAFLDADDIALPERFAEQLDFARRNPDVDVIGSRVVLIDENGDPAGIGHAAVCGCEETGATLLFENCIAQSSAMMRRRLFEQERFRTEFIPAEDYDLWARLQPVARFANIPHALVKYRIHAEGISMRREEAMKAAVRAIHAAGIARLGPAATESQLDIHTSLNHWPLRPTMPMLQEAENWLGTLKDRNASSHCHAAVVFEKMVARRWQSVCMDSWQLGLRAVSAYWRSPLRSVKWISPGLHWRLLRLAVSVSLRKAAGFR